MKGQDRTFCELTTDPWIYLLVILIGIVILFFVCATRVQASLNESTSFDARQKETGTMLVEHKTADDQFKLQASGDYSDISNERAGNSAASQNPRAMKGTVRTGGKRSFLGNILGFLKVFLGFGSADSSLDALYPTAAYSIP